MAHSYHEIAFTPTILDMQVEAGSRAGYAGMAGDGRYAHRLTDRETDFIARRDSFYMASVSETGWPYVQHRGGPAGFMKVLDEQTIGFADFSGNRQYVSTGNFRHDDRVSLFFMDYPNRRRLKMFGRVRVVDASDETAMERLEDPAYGAQVERGYLITVEGFDWNCPAHITPRFSEAEVQDVLAELSQENHRLRSQLKAGAAAVGAAAVDAAAVDAASAGAAPAGAARLAANDDLDTPTVLGDGALEVVISGVRQLTPRVRAYELRDPQGRDLPAVEPGSHLRVPVRLAGGEVSERHYSIASNPARRDIYEIAVLREDEGKGGSLAIHAGFDIGTTLRLDPPSNHFSLHDDERPGILIAGGIGITPIKAMAQALDERGARFHLHYAGRSRSEMAFSDRLERHLGDRITVYSGADGERLDLESTLAAADPDAVVYVCGPERLIAAVQAAARTLGIARDRIRSERFS